MATQLLQTWQDGVLILELNRPEKRNALTRQLLGHLVAAVEAGSDAAAIVLCGAGPAFCAGWDLDEVRSLAPGEPLQLSREIQAALRAIETAPPPVLAAVDGPARGGGCGLACAADIRVLGLDGSIGVPEVAVGTIPGGGIIRRLEALAGHGVAAEMLFTGEPLDAQRCLQVGLANVVVPPGQARSTAVAMARRISGQRAEAVRASKRVLLDARLDSPDDLVEAAAQEIETLLGDRHEENDRHVPAP